jgi:hypothetical protein
VTGRLLHPNVGNACILSTSGTSGLSGLESIWIVTYLDISTVSKRRIGRLSTMLIAGGTVEPTGPSLTRVTSIIAANTPSLTLSGSYSSPTFM